MDGSHTVVVILELPVIWQSNERIYLPLTKPDQAKYCLFTCFFAMSLQKRGFRHKDQILNGTATTTFRLPAFQNLI